MCSSAKPRSRALPALLLALAAACGGSSPVRELPASLDAVEPSCGDRGAATPVVLRGSLPVKVSSSLSGAGSSAVDATFRAWLGTTELGSVAWSGPGTLTAVVPAGLAAGDYPLTVETPFGGRVTKDAAFHVQAGPCPPAGASLQVALEVSPNTVTVGQQVTVRATVANVGLAPASGVAATLAAIPAPLRLVGQVPPPADVAAGATVPFAWTFAATAQSPQGGLTLEVDVAGRDAAGAPVTAPRARSNVLLVNAAATLAASAAAPARVSVGQTFTFSMTVTNAGAAGALVTPGLQVSAGAGPAPVTVVSSPGQRTVGPSSQQTFDFTLAAAAAGTATLTGTIAGTDQNSGLALDVAPTAPVAVRAERPPALSTTASAAPAVVASGGTVTVSARVQNDGEATADAVAASVAAAPPGFVAVPPLPAAQPVPGGAARDFTFTYRAGAGAGAGAFALDAAGVDQNGGAPVAAARATTGAVAAAYRVGGAVSGLAGGSLVLRLDGGSDLTVSANGSFAFAPILASGSPFAVTVLSQPASPSQTCTLAGDTGTVGTSDVTTVALSCRANRFAVGGTVAGLAGSGLVLHEAGSGQDARPSGDGAWAFASPLASGAAYAVTVTGQPALPSQTCAVANGAGTVASAAVTNVSVTCATRSFTVGGTVSGLGASGLVLHQGAESLAVPAGATSFTFATPVPSGGAYAVTATSPVGETCTVSNGAGTVTAADVTSVGVACVPVTFTLAVSITGPGVGGVLCGAAACPASAAYGTTLVLTAAPDATSVFDGWTGDCAGTGTCTLVMTANHAVTASFSIAPPPPPPPAP